MNLTSLISKSAKSLALLAMLAAMPMAASAEEMAKTPASQLTYEPQLDNQRDPNQYCAKCHKFDLENHRTFQFALKSAVDFSFIFVLVDQLISLFL